MTRGACIWVLVYRFFKETLNNSSLNCQSPETENAIFGFLTKSIPYVD